MKNATSNLQSLVKTDEKDKEFVYQIGQFVRIKALNINGRIGGIYIGPQRIVYDVRYFWEGTSKELYFRHSEIVPIEDDSKDIGFSGGTKQ